eukprot:g6752.t1
MSSGREQSEGSLRSDEENRRQYIEQNLDQALLELPLETAIHLLVAKFNFEIVREALEYAISTLEDSQSVPQTEGNLATAEVHETTLHGPEVEPMSTSMSTGGHQSRDSSPVPRIVRSRSTEDTTREPRVVNFGEGPSETSPLHRAPVTEPSYQPAHVLRTETVPRLDARTLQSLFAGSDVKIPFEQMQVGSESRSVRSHQTHETTITEPTFSENIVYTMRVRTTYREKVAIIVSNEDDGRLLVEFLKKEGFQSALMKKSHLNNSYYDETVQENQAVVLTVEDWNALQDQYKILTNFLIKSLRETEDIGASPGIQTLHTHAVDPIPFVREELPLSSLSAVNLQQENIHNQPRNASASEINIPRQQSLNNPSASLVNEELLLRPNEPDSQLFYSLQNFARGVITRLTNEIRDFDCPTFEELKKDYYKTSAFMNQLKSWMTDAGKHIQRSCCSSLYLLQETHNAVTLVHALGADNVKFLIAPKIANIREMAETGNPSVEDLEEIERLEEIIRYQLPDSVNFQDTIWFKKLVDALTEDACTTRPFRAVVVVQSRVAIWAVSKLLRYHNELKDVMFFPLYSCSKDPNAYASIPGLKLSRTEKEEYLIKFQKSESGILLVAVTLEGIENALPDLDILINFGCSCDSVKENLPTRKKYRNIKTGSSTAGSTYEMTQ